MKESAKIEQIFEAQLKNHHNIYVKYFHPNLPQSNKSTIFVQNRDANLFKNISNLFKNLKLCYFYLYPSLEPM